MGVGGGVGELTSHCNQYATCKMRIDELKFPCAAALSMTNKRPVCKTRKTAPQKLDSGSYAKLKRSNVMHWFL